MVIGYVLLSAVALDPAPAKLYRPETTPQFAPVEAKPAEDGPVVGPLLPLPHAVAVVETIQGTTRELVQAGAVQEHLAEGTAPARVRDIKAGFRESEKALYLPLFQHIAISLPPLPEKYCYIPF